MSVWGERKSDAELEEMLRRAQVGVIVAASANVEAARVECGKTRAELLRAKRLLDLAEAAHVAAIAKRDEASEKVREYVEEYPHVAVAPNLSAAHRAEGEAA